MIPNDPVRPSLPGPGATTNVQHELVEGPPPSAGPSTSAGEASRLPPKAGASSGSVSYGSTARGDATRPVALGPKALMSLRMKTGRAEPAPRDILWSKLRDD